MEQQKATPPTTPEIDPEIAATERERQERASAGSLIRAIRDRLLNMKSTPAYSYPHAKSARDRRRESGSSRAVRRAIQRYGKDPDARKQPHARLGRAKLIRPAFLVEAEQRTAVRRYLSKIKISALVPECPEMKLVEHFGSVFALASASPEMIKAVRGLGPAKQRKIRDYLISKNVPVNW